MTDETAPLSEIVAGFIFLAALVVGVLIGNTALAMASVFSIMVVACVRSYTRVIDNE